MLARMTHNTNWCQHETLVASVREGLVQRWIVECRNPAEPGHAFCKPHLSDERRAWSGTSEWEHGMAEAGDVQTSQGLRERSGVQGLGVPDQDGQDSEEAEETV